MTRAAAACAAIILWGASAAFAQNAQPAAEPARDTGVDFTTGVGMLRDSDRHAFAGIRHTAAFNVSAAFAVIVEAEWLAAIAERNSSGRVFRDNQTAALAGIRLRAFVDSPAVPYLQLSAGYVGRKDNGLRIRRSLFAFRSDVGLDAPLSRHIGIRAGGGWTFLFADEPYRNQFGGTVALTVSLGQR